MCPHLATDRDNLLVAHITDKTKFSTTTKDGAKEGKYEDFEKRLSSDKAVGKMKMDITVEKDTITEFKVKGGKKDKN